MNISFVTFSASPVFTKRITECKMASCTK